LHKKVKKIQVEKNDTGSWV